MTRDPQTVQREIEDAREAMARGLDQLATRASPKRLATRGRESLLEKARTPAGMAVVGGVAALVTAAVVWRVRRSR